jgi:hypothetical protein
VIAAALYAAGGNLRVERQRQNSNDVIPSKEGMTARKACSTLSSASWRENRHG